MFLIHANLLRHSCSINAGLTNILLQIGTLVPDYPCIMQKIFFTAIMGCSMFWRQICCDIRVGWLLVPSMYIVSGNCTAQFFMVRIFLHLYAPTEIFCWLMQNVVQQNSSPIGLLESSSTLFQFVFFLWVYCVSTTAVLARLIFFFK